MFKTINDGKLPTRATRYSACVDLYANSDIVIEAGSTKLIPLGVMIDLDALYKKLAPTFSHIGQEPEFEEHCNEILEDFMHSHYIKVAIRSSLSLKQGLIISNGEGIIDMDYEGEIGLIVHNPYKKQDIEEIINIKNGFKEDFSDSGVVFKKGDRVAQATLIEHKSHLFGIESEDERTGGFGSTGTK